MAEDAERQGFRGLGVPLALILEKSSMGASLSGIAIVVFARFGIE